MKNRCRKGFTLIETLVVIAIFTTIGILSTRAIILSVQGSKKGSSSVTVRENLNYSLSVIERLLRNANKISSCVSLPSPKITYLDERDVSTSFTCVTSGSDKYIASGSANLRLTSTEVVITLCSITCNLTSMPPSVTIDVTARDVDTASTKEGTQISISSKILLRTY